jgi:iron complex transport system substrate-binding protein
MRVAASAFISVERIGVCARDGGQSAFENLSRAIAKKERRRHCLLEGSTSAADRMVGRRTRRGRLAAGQREQSVALRPAVHSGMGRAVVHRVRALLIAAVCILLTSACAERPVSEARRGPAARVVSLAPSITETIYGLGEGARLVGVCAHCDHPPEVQQVPRVGGYLAPSVEAVLAVEPDLVIAVPSPGNREAVRTIERAGVPILVVEDRTLDDLWAGTRAIAAALGAAPAGDALVARLQAGLDAVRARTRGMPHPGVLLVVGHSPLIVTGGGTLQDELIAIAGGRNVAADAGSGFPQIGLELVVARRPDVILDAAMGTEEGGQALFAELRPVPAVRDGRVLHLDPDALFRAGPRVVEAAGVLAAAIHGGAG